MNNKALKLLVINNITWEYSKLEENHNKFDDIEIEDVENWRGSGEKAFSHQYLVMDAIKKVLDNGAKDLHKGFWNTKIDKFGNAIRTYEEDTRKIFLGSINGLIMVTHRDWKDSDIYKDIIEKKINEIKIRRKFWKDEQWKWWSSLSTLQKQQLTKEGKSVTSQEMFNTNLDFDNYFEEDEERIYREVATLILDFIKDEMKDFEGEVLIG